MYRIQWIAFTFLKFRINKGINKHSVEAHLTNACHLPATLIGAKRYRISLKGVCNLLDEIFSFCRVEQLQNDYLK